MVNMNRCFNYEYSKRKKSLQPIAGKVVQVERQKDACERSNLWKQYVKIYFYVLMFLVGLGSLYFVNTIFLPPNPLSVNQLHYYALGNFLHGLWIAFCFFSFFESTIFRSWFN